MARKSTRLTLHFDAGIRKVLPHGFGVMREGHFGFIDIGVPALFPLKAVIALVTAGGEHAHGLLYRNVARSGEHVMTILFAFPGDRYRVFQMRVARVFSE